MSPEVDGKIYSLSSDEGQHDPNFPRNLVNSINETRIFYGSKGAFFTKDGSALQAINMHIESQQEEAENPMMSKSRREEEKRELERMTARFGLPSDSPYWGTTILPKFNALVEQRGQDIIDLIGFEMQTRTNNEQESSSVAEGVTVYEATSNSHHVAAD